MSIESWDAFLCLRRSAIVLLSCDKVGFIPVWFFVCAVKAFLRASTTVLLKTGLGLDDSIAPVVLTWNVLGLLGLGTDRVFLGVENVEE